MNHCTASVTTVIIMEMPAVIFRGAPDRADLMEVILQRPAPHVGPVGRGVVMDQAVED